MKTVTVQKRLNYKRATYFKGTGNLQIDLRQALDLVKTVGERKQLIDPAENTVLLINSVRENWSMLFGALLVFSPGRNQPLVTDDDGAVELTVEQLAPPPNKTGARRDFIESLLFFGIKNNHVLILQSAGLRARQLESHIEWLLHTQTSVLAADDRIDLADHPSQNAIAKALTSPIKSVSIGVPLKTASVTPSVSSEASTERKIFQPVGMAFDVLSSLLGGKWLNKMKLNESLDESRLKVEVLVSYTRETNQTAQDLINDIAIKLRHQDPNDVAIELKNGGKLTGNELQISGPVSVSSFGGLVDPSDLFPKMRDWLATHIDMGVIDA